MHACMHACMCVYVCVCMTGFLDDFRYVLHLAPRKRFIMLIFFGKVFLTAGTTTKFKKHTMGIKTCCMHALR